MLKFIKDWQIEREQKTERILHLKVLEIRHWTTKFFEDLQKSKGSVELPAWIECKNLMNKLQIDMNHPKIINYYFRKLQKYKLANGIK